MNEGYRSRFILLLVFAGIASAVVSLWGLMAGGWGGFFYDRGQIISIPHLMFWLSPALSFPAFVIYLAFRRVGLFLAWLVPICTWLALFLTNWQSCMRGDCTTTNPILIFLSSFLGNV